MKAPTGKLALAYRSLAVAEEKAERLMAERDALQELLNERDAELDRLKAPLSNEAVRWVVNSLGELGVLIRGQAFFLYKGCSLQYAGPDDGEGGAPLLYRPVGKREFGECCHPLNARDPYRQGEVSVDDGNDWAPVPLRAVRK